MVNPLMADYKRESKINASQVSYEIQFTKIHSFQKRHVWKAADLAKNKVSVKFL